MESLEMIYKNAKIVFDVATEEWVAYLNTDEILFSDVFKRDASLKKIKESIDRFNASEFTPLPIYYFDVNNEIQYADIISFTETENLCWIKHTSGSKNGKREKIHLKGLRKIYSCENIMNESKLLEILKKEDEIKKKLDEIQLLKRDKIHLIYQLQNFDISGLRLSYE